MFEAKTKPRIEFRENAGRIQIWFNDPASGAKVEKIIARNMWALAFFHGRNYDCGWTFISRCGNVVDWLNTFAAMHFAADAFDSSIPIYYIWKSKDGREKSSTLRFENSGELHFLYLSQHGELWASNDCAGVACEYGDSPILNGQRFGFWICGGINEAQARELCNRLAPTPTDKRWHFTATDKRRQPAKEPRAAEPQLAKEPRAAEPQLAKEPRAAEPQRMAFRVCAFIDGVFST